MKFSSLMLVGLGGFFGSIARYVLAANIDRRLNEIFPFGTFAVNVLGSFLLGVFYGLTLHRAGEMQQIRLFLITGFCGGFTTFSAFAFENLSLLDSQKAPFIGLAYILLSVSAGIAAVFAGIWLSR